ncbi:MAG: HlyD family secretion protein [Terriglobales bacterium]
MNPKKRFSIVLSALLLIALAYYFFSTDRTTAMVLIGTVDANQVIVSSKVVGRLETLNFDEGQNVKAGDLVATVDSAEYLAMRNAATATLASLRTKIAESSATAASTQGDTANQVANSRAMLLAARSTLKTAIANRDLQEADTRRTVALADQGVMSQQERDRAVNSLRAQQAQMQTATDQVSAAETALEAAIARTNQGKAAVENIAETREQARNAQAQLAQAEVQLGYTKIFAPISGMVNVRAARQGEVVTVGTPILTIVDLTETWVYAPLPETYADAVRLGDVLTVRMPSGARLQGKVIAKAAEGDFATQRDVSRRKRDIKTVQIKLLIDNPGMQYVPGMTAEVLLPKSKLVTP